MVVEKVLEVFFQRSTIDSGLVRMALPSESLRPLTFDMMEPKISFVDASLQEVRVR